MGRLYGTLAQNGTFPAPGACGGTPDATTYAPNCFAGIDIDNSTLASEASDPTPANPFTYRHPTTANSMLSASDCGRSIEIPLHAGPFAVATNIAGTRDGEDIVISWTTTAPFAISSLESTGEVDCNDATASQHRFANANVPSITQAAVQPLSAPEKTQTDLGEVRVWYGDRTDFTIP